MNIFLDAIHLPNVFSGSQDTVVGQLGIQITKQMKVVSHYMKYNEITLGGSVMAINFALLAIAEKIAEFASHYFQRDIFKKPWLKATSSFLFKGTVMGGFLYGIDHLMDLKLHYAILIGSVVTTLFLQIIGKKLFCPATPQEKNKAKIDPPSEQKKPIVCPTESSVPPTPPKDLKNEELNPPSIKNTENILDDGSKKMMSSKATNTAQLSSKNGTSNMSGGLDTQKIKDENEDMIEVYGMNGK